MCAMIIKFKRPAAIFCGIILMVFGLLFLLYAVFGMNGDEEIRAKKTIAQHDTSVDPEKPMVALTYDDGPYTPVTGRILESLKAVGGRATFFVCRQQNRRSRGNNKENNRIRLRNRQSHLRTCRAYQNRQRKRLYASLQKIDEVIFVYRRNKAKRRKTSVRLL